VFARGYLHQDMVPEYGDASRAAQAYVADLSGDERESLAAEARRMAHLIHKWTAEELNQQLQRMGAACTFASVDDFLKLLRIFEESR
jgi:hypothetical protein